MALELTGRGVGGVGNTPGLAERWGEAWAGLLIPKTAGVLIPKIPWDADPKKNPWGSDPKKKTGVLVLKKKKAEVLIPRKKLGY